MFRIRVIGHRLAAACQENAALFEQSGGGRIRTRMMLTRSSNRSRYLSSKNGDEAKEASSSSSSSDGNEDASSSWATRTEARARRLGEAVARMETVLREGPRKQNDKALEHEWWRLDSRFRRSPSLAGWVTSYAASWMVQYAGVLSDGRFEEGAARALEALHDAMSEGDESGLRRFCDAPLATSLTNALAQARDAGFRIEHGVRVLERPRIAWWRIVVGLERSRATWETRDGRTVVVDDWCALDARSRIGVLLVLPRGQFEPVKEALQSGSVKTVYDAVSTAMDEYTVSVQAAVDFPSVQEALIAYTGDGSKAQDYWAGSTDGFAYTSRQLIFETAVYRAGFAVDQPEWRLLDVDNLLDGGAPYWRYAITPSS